MIELLEAYGLDRIERIASTGVVATLKGKRAGSRSIGLRSDMDALPIHEVSDAGYRSRNANVMHACGHDGHMAMMLGAARYLATTRNFAGVVHFIFQPAEEGRGGARKLIDEGLFERFPCDAVYGMHNYPGVAAGHFAINSGPFMAGVNRWWVTFSAKGGHGGAGHHKTADLTVVQAQFILALQTIVSRNVPSSETCVISVGHISAGSYWTGSILPSKLVVAGTARSFSSLVDAVIEERIPSLAHGLASLYGCECEVEMRWLARPLINHKNETLSAADAAQRAVGASMVDTAYPRVTGGEDFCEMLSEIPGALIFIGNGVDSAELHTPSYDFNDKILDAGIRYWIELVELELAGNR